MRTIDVGVRHDDDFMVADFIDIKIIAANASAQGGNQRADFLARQHFVKTCAFHIQDFTAQGQNRLKTTFTSLLGRAPCGITLHDEQFSFGRIAFLAIGKFAGKG